MADTIVSVLETIVRGKKCGSQERKMLPLNSKGGTVSEWFWDFWLRSVWRELIFDSGVLVMDRGWQAVARAMGKIRYDLQKTGL